MVRSKLANRFQLTRDPVFQLNSCLWLVRKAPGATGSPAYHAHGFIFRAIGRRLGISDALRKLFRELGWSPEPPEPDVLIYHTESHDSLVIECKAQGFGPSSSTAQQGRKLLSVCSEPDIAVGSPRGSGDAYVLYALPQEDVQSQLETLASLSAELKQKGLSCARWGAIGLEISDGALWADLVVSEAPDESPINLINKRVWVTNGDEQSARPLYLVPYDPTAVDNQSPAEREYCTAQLVQRVLTHAMSRLGRAEVPDFVRLHAHDALKEATFQISDYWQASELKKLENRIAAILATHLKKGSFKNKVQLSGSCVEVHLDNLADQSAIIAMLHKAQTDAMAQAVLDPQLQLDEADPLSI